VTDDALLALLRTAADAVAAALDATPSWALVPGSHAQHHSDIATDTAVHAVLDAAGVGVLSEESGLSGADADIVVVVDPLDGSTNAAQGLPWYATSLCAVDGDGPRVAVVRNLASGEEFTAVRGAGAWRDGVPLAPRPAAARLSDAVVGLSGHPARHLGWRQFRALGALALDLCAVAEGRLDAYLDCSVDAHGVWDYLGGVLVCREAGATVVDARGRDLVVLDPAARRTPVAGPAAVVAELVAAWPAAVGDVDDELERPARGVRASSDDGRAASGATAVRTVS
jgi:fructose-1,6-bisphosphatase/inositol monophosphatase family enzyme